MTDPSTSLRASNWKLIGHEWAVDMLRQHVARDGTRHAYLFAGPPGAGRRTLALRFAQALNCAQAVEPGIPCGTCRDCKQIKEMRHPDLSIIEPTVLDEKKQLVPNPNGEIRISQIRDLHRNINLKPYQSKYRVAIFLNFHVSNENASNALLKVLEEAPSYAVLILTADNPEALLPTIVSRCEVLRLRPLPTESVASFLKQHGAEEDKANLLARVSGGRPGYALRLLQDPSALTFREEKLADLQSLLRSTRVDKFAYAEKLSKDKDAMRNVILLWLSFWRDALLRAGGASTPIANADRAKEIESLAGAVRLSEARRVVSDLEKALAQLDASVNARLLAEVLLLDWPKV